MRKRNWSKEIFGWAMYDWANSAYTTSIQTVIFSVYFVKTLVPAAGVMLAGHRVDGTSLWGYLNSFGMLLVILISPGLGATADRNASKHRHLSFWIWVGSALTMSLFWATPNRLGWAILSIVLASLAYEMSLVFYNAFLKNICPEEESGYVSGLGFALGYIGGGLCLALNMLMIAKPRLFHLLSADPTLPARMSFFTVGIWWLLFSIPVMLWVKDRREKVIGGSASFFQLFFTLRESFREKATGRFLLSYLIYNDGIQTIILMAAVFGAQALGMNTVQLGLCYLMIQFVAFFGATICGSWADRWSHKKVILVTLAIYAAVTIWGMIMKSQLEFWILGFVIGLILGGSQAASRSLFSNLIPQEKSGEMFALFSVVGKASSFFGPLVFGAVNQVWGLRPAVGSLLIFFLVGGTILATVKE
jgi:MFS transporter, UMF1 family